MGQQYFLVESIQQVGADQVVKGQFIVDGEIGISGGQTSALASEQPKPKSKPKIKPLKPRELKWIIGPSGFGKETAELMGYETVRFDDISYPGPRI